MQMDDFRFDPMQQLQFYDFDDNCLTDNNYYTGDADFLMTPYNNKERRLTNGYEHQSSVVRTWPPLEHENDMFHDQQICLKLNLEPVFGEPSDLKDAQESMSDKLIRMARPLTTSSFVFNDPSFGGSFSLSSDEKHGDTLQFFSGEVKLEQCSSLDFIRSSGNAACPLTSSLNNETPKSRNAKTRSRRKQKPRKGHYLWQFILELLEDSERQQQNTFPTTTGNKCSVRWESKEQGVFRIIDSKMVANLWGIRKNNATMTYAKLSRSLRWCRSSGYLSEMPKNGNYAKKLCFRFGHRALFK